MADVTINGLATELLVAGANDLVPIWDIANSITKKIKRSNLVGANITGGGTIALGGFTLTVPASGTAALLAVANTFTTVQGIAPSATNAIGLNIAMPASTSVNAVKIEYAGNQRIYMAVTAIASQIGLQAADYGATIGPSVVIERNTNGTGAAGNIRMMRKDGTEIYWWNDASSNARLGTTPPTSGNDTSGTVIGTQTSSRDSKNVLGEFTDYAGALAAIVDAPLYEFTYKSGAFNGERFTGIVTDDAPVFGMDRDEAHPAGKSLNEITAHGYEMAAIKLLWAEIVALKAEVARLKH